jgi:hypothetical protein
MSVSAWPASLNRYSPQIRDHAATDLCWLSTAAIFRQPSILRNLLLRL